jgi:hypothetical protein
MQTAQETKPIITQHVHPHIVAKQSFDDELLCA